VAPKSMGFLEDFETAYNVTWNFFDKLKLEELRTDFGSKGRLERVIQLKDTLENNQGYLTAEFFYYITHPIKILKWHAELDAYDFVCNNQLDI
jgi:hypothetical protein